MKFNLKSLLVFVLVLAFACSHIYLLREVWYLRRIRLPVVEIIGVEMKPINSNSILRFNSNVGRFLIQDCSINTVPVELNGSPYELQKIGDEGEIHVFQEDSE